MIDADKPCTTSCSGVNEALRARGGVHGWEAEQKEVKIESGKISLVRYFSIFRQEGILTIVVGISRVSKEYVTPGCL